MEEATSDIYHEMIYYLFFRTTRTQICVTCMTSIQKDYSFTSLSFVPSTKSPFGYRTNKENESVALQVIFYIIFLMTTINESTRCRLKWCGFDSKLNAYLAWNRIKYYILFPYEQSPIQWRWYSNVASVLMQHWLRSGTST